MRLRLLTALLLAAAAGTLAGCEPYAGPTANCFSLVEGKAPCDFQALPGAQEGAGSGA